MLPVEQSPLGHADAFGKLGLRQPSGRADRGDIDARHFDLVDDRAGILPLRKGEGFVQAFLDPGVRFDHSDYLYVIGVYVNDIQIVADIVLVIQLANGGREGYWLSEPRIVADLLANLFGSGFVVRKGLFNEL